MSQDQTSVFQDFQEKRNLSSIFDHFYKIARANKARRTSRNDKYQFENLTKNQFSPATRRFVHHEVKVNDLKALLKAKLAYNPIIPYSENKTTVDEEEIEDFDAEPRTG